MNTPTALTNRRIMVSGLGRTGLSLAIRAAEAGYLVQGIDIDADKVRNLRDGVPGIGGVSDERLRRVLANGSLRVRAITGADTDILPFDCVIIAVATPVKHEIPDRSCLEAAARLIGRNLRRGNTVIVESSSYPGTTEGLVADTITEESGFYPGEDYDLGFAPGSDMSVDDSRRRDAIPRLVSGTDSVALVKIKAFYEDLGYRTVTVSAPAVAEFATLVESIFSQVNIALVNELATVAHELSIDIWEALDAADTKPHGFLKHTPGPGVGGHRLPSNPAYLSWLVNTDLGIPLRLSEVAQEINDSMPAYVVHRAQLMLPGGLPGAKILILGATYKPGSASTRGAPALEIIELLRRKGAHVTISDPHVRGWLATPNLPAESVLSQVADFSLVIVVTDHDEFDYDKIADSAALVLDCRHRMVTSPTVASL